MAITRPRIGGEVSPFMFRIGMEMNIAEIQRCARRSGGERTPIQAIDLVEIPRGLRTKSLLGGRTGQ